MLAELAVGLIILARNPSSAGFVLVRLSGRRVEDVDGNDAREGCFLTCCAVGLERELRSLFIVEGFRCREEPLVLCDRLLAAPPSCFAAEDAVGAVRCEGSRTGFVGDFGRGLTKGFDEGDGCLASFDVLAAVAAVALDADGLPDLAAVGFA